MLQLKKETVNIWKYKVDNNANIVIFVRLWKTRMSDILSFTKFCDITLLAFSGIFRFIISESAPLSDGLLCLL